MPDRILRAGILTSDRVDKLSWAGEVFYRRLMSIVDDYGRYDGRPVILRSQLYPLKDGKVSVADVVKWLDECSGAGLVSCYHAGGKPYITILDFRQRIRSESKFPDPPPESAGNCGQLPADVSNSPPISYTNAYTNADAGKAAKPRQRSQSKPAFVTPTLDEINLYLQVYLAGKDFDIAEEAGKFWSWHQSRGWKLAGGVKVLDWKARVIAWFSKDRKELNNNQAGGNDFKLPKEL